MRTKWKNFYSTFRYLKSIGKTRDIILACAANNWPSKWNEKFN